MKQDRTIVLALGVLGLGFNIYVRMRLISVFYEYGITRENMTEAAVLAFIVTFFSESLVAIPFYLNSKLWVKIVTIVAGWFAAYLCLTPNY